MLNLAVFDIDGTLTDTNAVDDECFSLAVSEVLGFDLADLEWSCAPHVTDSSLLAWLCNQRHRREPEPREIQQTIRRFLDLLRGELLTNPGRFAAIPGACEILDTSRDAGWRVALATGGWMASAQLKLRAAAIRADGVPISTADEAIRRTDIVRIATHRARGTGAAFVRVVSIGDAIWDLETAAALSYPFVGVASGERAQRLKAAGCCGCAAGSCRRTRPWPQW